MNKKLIATILLTSLFTVSTAVVAIAAPASTNTVVTGRTEQNNQSGVIIPSSINSAIYHNVTKSVALTGTVIIDGPKLVLTVTDPNNNPVSADKVTVVKVADKTYTYSVEVDPSTYKGNVGFKIDAKTIYINGKPAGQTHTSAKTQTQTIHVAYVDHFEYSDFAWGTYDRSQNQYPYSYNLLKVWDDGIKVPQNVSGVVSGTGSVAVNGEDATYDGGIANVGTEIPPINIFSFEAKNLVWTYNESNKNYDLSFTLVKNLSNGQVDEVVQTVSGVAPSTVYTYTANDSMSPDYTQEFAFDVPAAPVVEVNGTVSYIDSQWTGKDANGGNIQEKYTLSYKVNNVEYSAYLSTNFTKVGTGFGDQTLSYVTTMGDQKVIVDYTLTCLQPSSQDNNTSKNGGNNK